MNQTIVLGEGISFPQTVKGWAVKSNGSGFEETSYVVEGPLKSDEVFVRLLACGVCHTDLYTSRMPGKIPGHEMVGLVAALGSDVQHLKIGQRVGIGWQYSSCKSCKYCDAEQETVCPKVSNFRVNGRGGFSDGVVWDSRFVFPIPEAIKTAHAGPLMCAGLTVFTALKHYLKGDKQVAVIGIGGLGHLAIQYASKMGAEVTAISTSSNKKAEAEAFGATHFINTSEPGALEAAKSSFDLVLNCVSGDVDWDLYMSLTGPFGRLCVLGVPNSPITIGAGQLIVGYRQLVGSLTGSSKDVKEMFEFSAKHGITPLVEELPFAELERAVEKVEKNTMRYRMVLNIAKSKEN